jgi:hypothetical protein
MRIQSPILRIFSKLGKYVAAIGLVASINFFHPFPMVSASNPFDDVFLSDRYGSKTLFMTPEVVTGLELAKHEAQKQNVQLEQIAIYSVVFYPDTFSVSLSPEYKGGLDGPTFTVEIRRTDMKVLQVSNTLETE